MRLFWHFAAIPFPLASVSTASVFCFSIVALCPRSVFTKSVLMQNRIEATLFHLARNIALPPVVGHSATGDECANIMQSCLCRKCIRMPPSEWPTSQRHYLRVTPYLISVCVCTNFLAAQYSSVIGPSHIAQNAAATAHTRSPTRCELRMVTIDLQRASSPHTQFEMHRTKS